MAVDCGSEGMQQLRPARNEQPESGAAGGAEAALRLGSLASPVIALDLRAEAADLVFAFDLQRCGIGREVDCEAAAARRLAADRAVAELVGDRGMAFDREMHGSAAAGPFERDRHDAVSFLCQTPARRLCSKHRWPPCWTNLAFRAIRTDV